MVELDKKSLRRLNSWIGGLRGRFDQMRLWRLRQTACASVVRARCPSLLKVGTTLKRR